MARSIPGASDAYLLLSVLQDDLERMNPASRRAYLQLKLRYLDGWIQALLDRHTADQSRIWLNPDAREAVEAAWDEALQLDYLEAVREAISETLANL